MGCARGSRGEEKRLLREGTGATEGWQLAGRRPLRAQGSSPGLRAQHTGWEAVITTEAGTTPATVFLTWRAEFPNSQAAFFSYECRKRPRKWSPSGMMGHSERRMTFGCNCPLIFTNVRFSHNCRHTAFMARTDGLIKWLRSGWKSYSASFLLQMREMPKAYNSKLKSLLFPWNST